MASVDLNHFLNRPAKASKSSQINSKSSSNAPIYIDLHLDLVSMQTAGQGSHARNANDIRLDYDDFAIKNAVNNLLNIRAGYKILSPEISTALDQYLFDVVSDDIGRFIGDNIVKTLQNYEPRITVRQCIVQPLPDQNAYNIQLIYSINAKPTKQAIVSISINNGQITVL